MDMKTDSDDDRYAGSLPMKIAYGRDVDVKTDHYVHIAEEAVAMGADLFFPGAIMVNLFPFGTSLFYSLHGNVYLSY